jgi:hypothetical protein
MRELLQIKPTRVHVDDQEKAPRFLFHSGHAADALVERRR